MLMTRRAGLVTLAMAVSLSACIEEAPSIHPLFETSETLPALAGDWAVEGQVFAFEETDYGYLVRAAGGEGHKFKARFGRLNGELFMDMTADRRDAADEGMFPVHVFSRVRLRPDRLEIASLSQKWLRQAVVSGQVFLAHVVVDGEDILITASTDELQRVLAQWTFLPEAFEEPVVFTRPTPPPAGS